MECRTKKEDDGFYHPPNEKEIACLVKKAYDEGLQVRCRGAAHSVAWSIYTDPGEGDKPIPNKVSQEDPPEGPNINIMLDKFTGLVWEDPENGIVVADAGIHLGKDPRDPTGASTLENGLLYQAFKKGFGLNDLGGITHQTVSGFLMTGSAGGSLKYDLSENIIGFKIIDGMGNISDWINKGDPIFNAVSLSLGLLGIITKVKLKLRKTYNITGQEVITLTEKDKCPIDLFGPGDDGKPSMRKFLEQTPYTRLLWWPQKKVNRVGIWQAERGPEPTPPDFKPVPYEEFEENFGGQLEQLVGAVFFTLLGNKGFFKTLGKLGKDFRQFKTNIKQIWQKKMGKFLAWLFSIISTGILGLIIFFVVLFFSIFKPLLLWLYPSIVGIFQPLTKEGKEKTFQDYYWRSLPMDNTADDILIGTEFTEIFIPLQYTERAMQLLNELYVKEGYSATSFYSTELYAGHKSKSWMNPAYEEGEYSNGTFRIDIFWYINNEGNPAGRDGYFKQFWDLFMNNKIPFRLHWGKFIPDYDYKEWANYYKSQFPRWDDFLDLRKERDPKNIFLTKYWKLRLLGEK